MCVSGTSQLSCDKWWFQTKPAPSLVGAVGSINHQCCNFPGGSNNSVGRAKIKSLHLAGCNGWHHIRVEEMPSGKQRHLGKGAHPGWSTLCSEMWLHPSPSAVLAGIVTRHLTHTTLPHLANSRASRGEHFPPAVPLARYSLLPAGRINPILFARWQEMCAGNRRPRCRRRQLHSRQLLSWCALISH